MQDRKKVLILYNKLFHYRIPIFNLLAKQYDLTVIYSYDATKECLSQCKFKTQFVPILNIYKFVIHRKNIFNIVRNYDVVIAYGQITWLSYSLLSFDINRKYKLLYWSIGVPASYKRRYGDANKLHYIIDNAFHHKADGLIFYSSYPKSVHAKYGYDEKKMFVADNTVEVSAVEIDYNEKENILFIGTLYMEKGLDILLSAYKAAFIENPFLPNLNIVGGGEQFDIILSWIAENNLSHKIHLLGPIYDQDKKAEIFLKSIVCISPKQAGLSVLESMGYGVPYITMNNAVTGGELFNIKNGITGVMLSSISEFKDIILDVSINREKYVKMGENAYNHYWNCRKPEDMARGIIDAIENV